MKTANDRASMGHLLSLDLDAQLLQLLRTRFASLVTEHGDLTEWTELLIVEPGDRESDVVREVGFSPLVEPIEGARYGSTGFHPFWDHLRDHGCGWYELTITFGSTFAYVLFIQDAEGTDPDLLALCRGYAA
jgi:hypothetical protein